MSEAEANEGAAPASGWAEAMRRAPLGVLVLGSILSFLGAGLVLGGFYLAIARSDAGWMPWLVALGLGPLTLYLAMHLLALTRWSWLAMTALLGLLLASAVLRALGAPSEAAAPLAEVAVELACLYYLTRRTVRGAFGWG